MSCSLIEHFDDLPDPRVMSCLSPKALPSCFVRWVQSIAKITEGEIVAIDGKQARRSYDTKNHKAAIHRVSA